MCEQCKDIDEKIAHYRELGSRILDKELLNGIATMIAELLAAKERLHPTKQQ